MKIMAARKGTGNPTSYDVGPGQVSYPSGIPLYTPACGILPFPFALGLL